MDDFYLTLPSNVRIEGNTTSKYRTILPKSIDLNGSWLVALVELQFPFSWANLNEQVMIELKLDDYETVMTVKVPLVRNYYKTIHSLLKHLNQAVNAALKIEFGVDKIEAHLTRRTDKYVVFEYDSVHHRVSIAIRELYTIEYLKIPAKLAYLLGFISGSQEELKILDRYRNKAPYPPDLTGGLNAFYIYCDAVEPVIVGDVIAPLLRVVSLNTTNVTYGQSMLQIYSNPHYLPVTSKHLRDVLISINDDNDQPIKFSYGKAIVQLHFKRAK